MAIFNPIYGGAAAPNLGTKTITANGTYNASSDNLDGYSQVVVNVDMGMPISVANSSYIFNDLGLSWETSAEEQTE